MQAPGKAPNGEAVLSHRRKKESVSVLILLSQRIWDFIPQVFLDHTKELKALN